MKIKNGFLLRKVSEAFVVVAVGDVAKEFNGIITLNSTGAFLWEKLSQGCDGKEVLVDALLEEYDVEKSIAEKDVNAFIERIKSVGALED